MEATKTKYEEDPELVNRLRSGDSETYRRIMDTLSPALFREARRWVHDDDAAHDVVQDTWLAVWTSIDRFRGDSLLRTWIYNILRRRAITRYRKDSRLILVAEPDEDSRLHWQGSRQGDPSDAVVMSEALRATTEALGALPRQQQEVMVRHAVLDEPPATTRLAVGVSEANRRVLLHRARRQLREQVAWVPAAL